MTSTRSSTKTPLRVPEHRHARALVDTSVVIDLDRTPAGELPAELAVSTVTLAELAAGPHATTDLAERARRQDRLQRVEAAFDPLPVDASVARAYGRVYATLVATGAKPRGRRAFDLLIASTALAAGLPLYTRNRTDFAALEGLVDIVSVESSA